VYWLLSSIFLCPEKFEICIVKVACKEVEKVTKLLVEESTVLIFFTPPCFLTPIPSRNSFHTSSNLDFYFNYCDHPKLSLLSQSN